MNNCYDPLPRPTTISIDLGVGDTVEITSPNYPQDYPGSLRILWVVHAPANYRVSLRFIAFNTEATYDFLYVDAGREPELSFSGEGDFDDIISSASYMVLTFVSDFSTGKSGFKLELSAVHEEAPFELEEGESITFLSRSNSQFVDESPLEWSVVSTDPTLDLIVIIDYVELLPGDFIRVTSIEADIGEDYVWTIEGPLSRAFGEAADKVFPSGNLLIQATTLAGTRDFTMEVMALHPQDISGCPGTDRIIIPQKICDGIVTCPDNSDEPTCGPLETIVLNEGEVASIQTPGYPLLVTPLPLQMIWTIQVTPPSRILMDVLSLITEASHTLMIGTGLDYSDEGSIVFKVLYEMWNILIVEGPLFNDEHGIEVGDITPPGNSMWISIEKPLTDVTSRLVLSANIRAVSEESRK
nr:uncharacterized protein LOC129270196 [Lytechinus pictus]